MSSFNKVMAREMSKSSGGKLIRGNVMRSVNPLIEWIKWLSYNPVHEQDKINYIYSKRVEDLSIDELKEILKYKERNRMSQLFIKYNKGECSEEEYMEVYHYMGKSITDLMMDKLNSEELTYAKKEILGLSAVPQNEVRRKIEAEQKEEIYMSLSMVDSYILHIISDINYRKSLPNLDRKIQAQLERNDVMRQKSLSYASNQYSTK